MIRPGAPKVSVVLPVYNRGRVLGRALRSVLDQTFDDFELIVVDDASTDDTREVVASFTDDRIRYLRIETNRGAAAARNLGVSISTGNYIAFIDSDDEWLSDKLARQIEVLSDAGPRVGGCMCDYQLIRKDGKSVTRNLGSFQIDDPSLLDGCYLSPGTTLMVRRDVMVVVGLFREDLARFEDWDWLLRFVKHYELVSVKGVQAVIHVGNSPSPEMVDRAARRLYAVQSERVWEIGGRKARKRFKASLKLEVSIACLRYGRVGAAALHMLSTAANSPTRAARFFRRMAEKAFERDLC